MIEGLNLLCTVGPVEICRSPRVELVYRRRAVLSRATVVIPDPFGEVRAALAVGQSVRLHFGYRGESALSHEWEGTAESVDQPGAGQADADGITVRAVGLEKALATTMVTESFYGEPANVVARRLFERTGLPVAGVDIPADVLPHQVFSGVSVARAIKQLDMSLARSFGHDLSRHAVWLGQNGLVWSAEDEPGAAYRIATAENLLSHTPPPTEAGVGVVTAVLLPGLLHSQQVHIQDARRGTDVTVRALDVIHTLSAAGNTTSVSYGTEPGWG